MISDPWTDRLSDYIDGELGDADRAVLERHLAACPTCSAALADLVRIVERARRLPDRPPPGDVWAGIAPRIGLATVPDRSPGKRVGRRRWSFSLPQLAAASLAIAVASGGGAWWLAVRGVGGPPAALPPVTVAPPGIERAAGLPDRGYDAAVADLERVLDTGRSTLDTSTVRIIERNLAVIDRAIVDARRALAADPGNAYLNAHLANTMRRKLDLLRQAATLAVSRS